MASLFEPGDYVLWENRIYLVKTIICMNPNITNDPYVCGLVSPDKPNSFTLLLVREKLLKKVYTKGSGKALKVLYGN